MLWFIICVKTTELSIPPELQLEAGNYRLSIKGEGLQQLFFLVTPHK